jgi:hypothetical protein
MTRRGSLGMLFWSGIFMGDEGVFAARVRRGLLISFWGNIIIRPFIANQGRAKRDRVC